MPPRVARPLPELALGLGGVLLVAGLALMVSVDLTDAFDGAVIETVRSPALSGLLTPLRAITELGSTWAVTAVAIVVVLLGVALGMPRHGVAGALTVGLASIANSTFKLAIARERPDLLDPVVVERGFSFPSGHSATGMVAYGVLAVVVARSALPAAARVVVVSACALIVALIGLSRVWLGVHYPTDVIAGWAAGGLLVLVYVAVIRAWPARGAASADADRAAPRSDRPVPG